MTDWWLIDDPPLSPSANMAKDAFLLDHASRWERPVLRLYEWNVPTLSLGRNQRAEGAVDLGACAREGVAVVRRMTGGWAVLHGADLTYSVTAPIAPDGAGPFGSSIQSTYRAIAQVFLRLFRGLGCEPAMHPYTARERVDLASPICFQTPSAWELMIGGKKLIGSAQRRREDAFLQHGSIPAKTQQDLLARLFANGDGRDLDRSMTDLDSLGLWNSLSPREFRNRLIEAFAEEFGRNWSVLPWERSDQKGLLALEPRYAPLGPAPEPRSPGAERFSSGARADRLPATSGRSHPPGSSGG